MKKSRLLKAFCCLASLLAIMAGSFVTAMAMSDGAYVASRTTSYVNPETGETYDGGSNIALGDSMCASIVDDQVLIEQINGKIYVTVGFGLMSNISDVRIAVQSSTGGDYRNVSIMQTGTVIKNGDNCNQYRFEVPSIGVLIRPTFYVAPMGRDVTFYIRIDTDSITAGTGNFTSMFFGSAGNTSSGTLDSSGEDTSASSSSGSGGTLGSDSGSSMSGSSSDQSSSNSSAESQTQGSATDGISGINTTLGTGEEGSVTDLTTDLGDGVRNSTEEAYADAESQAQKLAEVAATGDITVLLADVKGLTVYKVNDVTAEDGAISGSSAGQTAGLIAIIILLVVVSVGGIILYLRRENSKEAS